MSYIDADKLIAILNNRIERCEKEEEDGYPDTTSSEATLKSILPIITSLQQEHPIKVYRVENEKEQKGLWRKFDGTWEPLFDMLTDGQCKDMPMDDDPIYREGGKQWFASAPSKEALQKWFSKRDLEELTAKGFTISEFEVVGHKKISKFEYIFTRDNIVNRTYLKVSDIYPQKQPLTVEKVVEQCKRFGGNPEVIQPEVDLEKEITDKSRACCNCINGILQYPNCFCWQHKHCNTDEPYKIPKEDWVETAKTCKEFEFEL